MVTIEQIVTLLNTNPKAVERAMVVLFERQTADEQLNEVTSHNNGVGFSGADAGRGTYYAKWVMSGRRLTGEHLDRARKMAVKYRGQLLEAAHIKSSKV